MVKEGDAREERKKCSAKFGDEWLGSEFDGDGGRWVYKKGRLAKERDARLSRKMNG
jgi:hypothetical protein